jgi:hypothetical protein
VRRLLLECIRQNLFGTGHRGPDKPGPVKRLPDGKPDLEGYWISQVAAAPYGVEEHPSKFGSFAGKSIVIDPPDGKIPYQGGARAIRGHDHGRSFGDASHRLKKE